MALKELSINQSATQLVADINSNIEEVGGSASVSADGSATSLVGVLNDVFDGVTGAEELSVGDSATDFVDKLNGNFEAAASGSPAREFEDLIQYDGDTIPITSKKVRVYKGDKIRLIKKNSDSPVMPTSRAHFDLYGTSESTSPTSSPHNVASWLIPNDGYLTIGNSVMPLRDLVNYGIMCSRSRSRCYVNPKHRWIVFGDSISVFTYSTEYGKDVEAGYSWIIGEDNHEIAVNNRATSGSGIVAGTGQPVEQAVNATNFAPYDICSIFIGTNDYTYGSRKESFKTNYRRVLDHVLEEKPTIKIFICTLIARSDRLNVPEFEAMSTGILELGQEYNIPVLDLHELTKGTVIDFSIPANVQNYSREGDGLHPTQEGHALVLAPLFKAKLMKVLNDYTLFPDILELENFDEI